MLKELSELCSEGKLIASQCHGGNLRVMQSRSATPRTSTSQHSGEPEEQTGNWRSARKAG